MHVPIYVNIMSFHMYTIRISTPTHIHIPSILFYVSWSLCLYICILVLMSVCMCDPVYTYTCTYSPLSPDLCVCICVSWPLCLYVCVTMYPYIHTPISISIYAPSHVVHTHTLIFPFPYSMFSSYSLCPYICIYMYMCMCAILFFMIFPRLCDCDPSFPSHRVTPGLCRPRPHPVIVWALFLEPRPPVCEGVRILACFIHWCKCCEDTLRDKRFILLNSSN